MIATRMPINRNQITVVSLESDELEDDMLALYEELRNEYTIKTVLMRFGKNNLWYSFLYMLNAMQQIWHINQSAFVIITDNNYVVSKFKREGVQVLQVWHATGAIKQFGNCIEREYLIQNYDYVLANSQYWITPYSKAFGVTEAQVVVLGMPRTDKLYDELYRKQMEWEFYEKYQECKGKRLLLYAPTFRGNIHKGIRALELDGKKIVEELDSDCILLYKRHPLLKGIPIFEHPQILEVSDEELYKLFFVSEMLISDYSSIVFDYALLGKPIVFYAPDLEEYKSSIGYFVDFDTMPGDICKTEAEIVKIINGISEYKTHYKEELENFRQQYFQYLDGENTLRIAAFIREKIANKILSP